MEAHIKNPFVLPLLIGGLGLMMLAGPVEGQVFRVVTSVDGTPKAALLLSSNTLYGTSSPFKLPGSSTFIEGTVFAVNTDGTDFSVLCDLGYSGSPGSVAGLVLSGNTLYGTTDWAGDYGGGTIFAVNTDGTGFRNMYSFTHGSDGAFPDGGLILSGNTLYGTTTSGNVFGINTDGTHFTNLHSYTAGIDGFEAHGKLVLSGNTLYGTAAQGGSAGGYGTVFAINTDGTGFTNLHSFAPTAGAGGGYGTNRDGAVPWAGLILTGNTLYGTASQGGSYGHGTVFAVNIDGTSFTNLYSFSGGSDGASPYAELLLSGNTLYGTTFSAGDYGLGTVFKLNTDGSGFTTLHSFNGRNDGANSRTGLILSGNTLYGTTEGGGSSGKGTVYSLSFPPQLTIIPSVRNVTLTWSASYAGFSYAGYALQFTTNLAPLAAWTTVPTVPVVVDGQNVVTNPISSTQLFFRLSQEDGNFTPWASAQPTRPLLGISTFGNGQRYVTQATILSLANQLKSYGLYDYGYKWFHLDDGLFTNRDANGNLQFNTNQVPMGWTGAGGLQNFLKTNGFKVGVFFTANDSGLYPVQYGATTPQLASIDASNWLACGVDEIYMDSGVQSPDVWPIYRTFISTLQQLWPTFTNAPFPYLNLSCEQSFGSWTNAAGQASEPIAPWIISNANSWLTLPYPTVEENVGYTNLMGWWDSIQYYSKFNRPGHSSMMTANQTFADTSGWQGDVPGTIGWTDARRQLAQAAMVSSPIYLFCPACYPSIYTNTDILSIHQDALWAPCDLVWSNATGLVKVYRKLLTDGGCALMALTYDGNTNDAPIAVTVPLNVTGLGDSCSVRDCLARTNLGNIATGLSFSIAPRDVALFRLAVPSASTVP